MQKSLEEDETSFVALQNVVEQACNYFFQYDRFPTTYEELQPVPLLKVGMLTYAGDDGREKGQAYRLALDLEAGVARFRFRYPDEAGIWHWRKADTIIPLPRLLKERLDTRGTDGSHPARRTHERMGSVSRCWISSSRWRKRNCLPGRASSGCWEQTGASFVTDGNRHR